MMILMGSPDNSPGSSAASSTSSAGASASSAGASVGSSVGEQAVTKDTIIKSITSRYKNLFFGDISFSPIEKTNQIILQFLMLRTNPFQEMDSISSLSQR